MSLLVVRLWARVRASACGRAATFALAAVIGCLVTASAHGQTTPQIYSCEDAQGRTISSDRPIQDCARRELRVLNRDGSLREVIPPPMTREQRKQSERAELERRDALARSRARQARDRSLLITFEDERSLETMRRRQLADIDTEIRVATARILQLDRELKTAQADAARQQKEHAGRPLPFAFQQRITDAANAILAEDSLIRDRQNERERLNERFDADAARLRELLGLPPVETATSSTPSTSPAERDVGPTSSLTPPLADD